MFWNPGIYGQSAAHTVAAPGIVISDIGSAHASSGTTLTVTPAQTWPAGGLIVLCVADPNNPLGSVSDGVNTYTAGPTKHQGKWGGIWYAYNSVSISASNPIVYTAVGTFNSTGDVGDMTATYVSAMQTSSDPLDGAVTATSSTFGASSTVTSAGTAGQAGEVFFGFCYHSTNTGAIGQDSGNGWAAPPTIPTTNAIQTGSQINAGTGTKTYANSWSGSKNAASIIFSFKHA